MASIPDPLTRRELLHLRQKRPVDHAGIGQAYLAQGRHSEALDFLERIQDAAERARLVGAVRDQAIALGDAFVLARVNGLLPLERGQWERAFAAAKAAGKPRFALRLARQLGDEAEVARLELELGLRVPEPVAPPPAEPADPVVEPGLS